MVDTSYAVPLANQSRVAREHNRINSVLQEQLRGPIPAAPTAPFRGDCCPQSLRVAQGSLLVAIISANDLLDPDGRDASIRNQLIGSIKEFNGTQQT
jgi:hypothetical protein